ncbi:MAG: hypothetical protein HY295_04610 [Thaumarchaeota archaeon]|nr:hypothetical protein [Nitrososphaerota archaeon]
MQRICKICGRKTDEQFHNSCLYVESIQTRGGTSIEVLPTHKDDRKVRDKNKTPAREKRTLYHSLLVFCMIGLFLFVYSSYLVTGGNVVDSDRISSISILKEPTHYTSNQENPFYENCLGSGTGKTLTVTCPNEKGYVYKAVLDMPKELGIKFSNTIFAIRGISLSEKSDGSVVLEYQKSSYTTRFLKSEMNLGK